MSSQFPLAYRWLRANGVTRLIPWHFLDVGEGDAASEQFTREDPEGRTVCTFARHQACDDFAGFKIIDSRVTDEVIFYHPSFQGAGPNPGLVTSIYPDLWIFLKEVVISESMDWGDNEIDIQGLEAGKRWKDI